MDLRGAGPERSLQGADGRQRRQVGQDRLRRVGGLVRGLGDDRSDRLAYIVDLALGEVSAHVAAIRVKHVDIAAGAAEDDQLLPEGVDRVRLAVDEVVDQTQAVPAAGEPGRRGLRLDQSDLVGLGLRRHRHH